MAYASLLSVANTSYPNQAGDGSYYASAQLAVSANTDLIISFVPVISGPAAPFAIVYAVDLNGVLVPIGRVDQLNQVLQLGPGSGKQR